MSLKEIAQLPVEEWNGRMVNDFEESVFPNFPLSEKSRKRCIGKELYMPP